LNKLPVIRQGWVEDVRVSVEKLLQKPKHVKKYVLLLALAWESSGRQSRLMDKRFWIYEKGIGNTTNFCCYNGTCGKEGLGAALLVTAERTTRWQEDICVRNFNFEVTS
jgi:hypothetical protein